MSKNHSFLLLVFAVMVSFFFEKCKKSETPIEFRLPSLSTNSVSSITTNGATCGGRIISDGNSTISVSGICWGTEPMPTKDDNKIIAESATDNFVINITGLNSGTLYYVRAYAINNVGISYGNQVSFRTLGNVPTAITNSATNITTTTATLAGIITANNLSTRVTFDYGATTNYGFSVEAAQSPIDEGSDINVSSEITGLTPNTVYHFRVKAENALGVTYGSDKIFTTLEPDGTIGSVTDIEGNIYKTIVIGGQTWMSENLSTTKYNDGSAIPNVTDGVEWAGLITPAYCWYGNNAVYKYPYGALYNWYAVNTGKLAPAGWHVPTNDEWNILINYLDGETVAGGKMKETGFLHWYSPNTDANNSSGFTAVPGGARFNSAGGFHSMRERGMWWTSTSSASPEYAFYYWLDAGSGSIDLFNNLNFKVDGFSVRCVKD